MSGSRPAISVVVPFAGDRGAADAAVANLKQLSLRADDELIVADNSMRATFPATATEAKIVPATHERSPFHARNVGAAAARRDWLLFLDADCRPMPSLLDQYFTETPASRTGLVAGRVRALSGQSGLAPRYARSRGHMRSEWHTTRHPGWPHPAAITGNMLVRTDAWRDAGGFHEGVIDGGDIEFSWRVQDAGWGFEVRPGAAVEHAHVERISATLRQARRHAAGRRWINTRYPGSFPRPPIARPLSRCAVGALVWTFSGRFERGLFKLIDARWFWADFRGYLFGENRTRPPVARQGPVCVLETFPATGQIAEYPAAGVEAIRRPAVADPEATRGVIANYAEDDRPLDRFQALMRLAFAHPRRLFQARRVAEARADPLVLAPLVVRISRERHLARSRLGVRYALVLDALVSLSDR